MSRGVGGSFDRDAASASGSHVTSDNDNGGHAPRGRTGRSNPAARIFYFFRGGRDRVAPDGHTGSPGPQNRTTAPGFHAGAAPEPHRVFHAADPTTTTVHSQYTYYYYGRVTRNVCSDNRGLWRWAA